MYLRIGTTALMCASVSALSSEICWSHGHDGVQQQVDDSSLADHVRRLSGIAAAESADTAALEQVIDDLRRHGQTAVNRLVDERNKIVAVYKDSARRLKVWDPAIDRVAGQKGAVESRLYWYTSLQAARRESATSGRPILSLRLLGRLDNDLSCANSRFFRRVLYPDSQIGSLLRDKFVLHWQSVRDVPIVTIEFGSERKLRQPLVGNSVHLVLDSQGNPFDAMPGLVSPDVFRTWLSSVDSFWHRSATNDQQRFWADVVQYHSDRSAQRRQTSPMAIGPNQSVNDLNPLDRRWHELALTHYQTLNPAGRQRLQQHQPAIAERAMVTAPTKAVVESPLMRMVRNFEQNMSRDTVFNLFALQTKLDDWFAAMPQPPDYQQLTRKIYADVFLMPLDDPWLGLSPKSAFTALESGGRIQATVYNDIQ